MNMRGYKGTTIARLFGSKQKGISLPEMTATLGVLAVLATIAAPTLTMRASSLNDSMNLLEGNFKVGRSKAMAQTKAFRISTNGPDKFRMEFHADNAGSNAYSCDDSNMKQDSNGNAVWTQAAGFSSEDMTLGDGVQIQTVSIDGQTLADTSNWNLCFDARGMANKNVLLTLEEMESGETRMLEVFSGGSLISYDSARFNQGASSPSGSSNNSSYNSNSNSSYNCNSNNGHGNNLDGVDSSNPVQQNNGQIDPSQGFDDEAGATQ